jgi:hypothetical protein
MINYELAILIAVASVTYSNILTQPNAIFNPLYNKLYNYFKTDERRGNGKPYHPLFMLLIHCEKCIAGQAAFWLYICVYAPNSFGRPSGALVTVLQLIFFTTFTIFSASIISIIYKKHTQ